MDKYFLLTYTQSGYDGFRHSHHAWFGTEEEMQHFVDANEEIQVDLAIEILSCREVSLREKKLI